MTLKRAYVTIISVGAFLLAALVVTLLTAQHLVGDEEAKPTTACYGYNTQAFQERFRLQQPDGDARDDREKAQHQQDGDRQDVGVASLEVACQSNALALSGFKMNYFGLTVACLALVMAILAVVHPAIVEDLRRGPGHGPLGWFGVRQADLVITAAYRADGTPAGWTIANTGRGLAHVHGTAVVPYTGGSSAAAAAAASFAGTPFIVRARGSERVDWTGAAVIGDLLVAVRFTDVAGRRGVSWARFGLEGCPSHHGKHEEGCQLEL